MNILQVLSPVVVQSMDATVGFYRDVLGLSVKGTFEHAGFAVSWLGPVVVLTGETEDALRVPRQVRAIFVVDDLDAFWAALRGKVVVLQEPWDVPTGRAFVVRHPDGTGVEYLQLRG